MDQFTVLLIGACAGFLMVGIAGGAAALFVARVNKKWMELCNSLAGGIMLAVALCHMLPDSINGLDEWSGRIGSFFGGDEFPLGFYSVGVGFFVIISLEYFLGSHSHSEPARQCVVQVAGITEPVCSEARDLNVQRHPDTPSVSETRSFASLQESNNFQIAGFATFLGLGLHSTIEGIGTGSSHDPATFGILTVAVLMHKGFAAFAVASSLLALSSSHIVLWWSVVVCWACTGPIGLIIGAVLRANVDNQGAALLQCLAAGTLLAVAITEMIATGLEDRSVWKKRKITSVYIGFTLMALIAIWA